MGKGSKLGKEDCISQTNDVSRCDISPTVMFELMFFRTSDVTPCLRRCDTNRIVSIYGKGAKARTAPVFALVNET